MRGRGRPRKAAVNSVVLVTPDSKHGLPYYGVVVDHRTDVRSNRYGVVETDWLGRFPRGACIWRNSEELEATGRRSIPPGRVYRKNVSPEERGCGCQCCEHIAGFDVEG